MIRPAVGVDRDVMAAFAVPAIDQHVADAERAHVAECDLGLIGQHHIPELKSWNCTSGHCASGQLSLTWFLSLDGWMCRGSHPDSQVHAEHAPV